MSQTIECMNARLLLGRLRVSDFAKMSLWKVSPDRPIRSTMVPSSERPTGSMSTAQSVSWAGMALPLAACVAIWGIGDASPANVAWLSILHGVIGTGASAWTVLRLLLRRRIPQRPRLEAAFWQRASLLALYALLGLQPILAIMASMLHGNHATLFGIPFPAVLSANPSKALQIDRMHGYNALLLLGLITVHVGIALRNLTHRRMTTGSESVL